MTPKAKYLLVFLWAVPTPAFSAGFMSGNELFSSCTANTNTITGVERMAECQGYLMGLTDGLGENGVICTPANIIFKQVEDIVLNYLRAHPERRQYSASSEASLALRSAFPCK
jgi:hypothetical protein